MRCSDSGDERCDRTDAEPHQIERFCCNGSGGLRGTLWKLVGEYKAKNAKFDQLQSEIADKKAREVQIQNFIRRVRELDTFVTEFDKGLWSDTAEYMTVYSKEKVVVTFKDGTEI